jgi:hypothetical protein
MRTPFDRAGGRLQKTRLEGRGYTGGQTWQQSVKHLAAGAAQVSRGPMQALVYN